MTREEFGRLLNLEAHPIPAGRHNRPGTRIRPTSITVHNTGNVRPGADALMHAKFLIRQGYYIHQGKRVVVSWHFTADDRRVVSHLPIDEMGFHAHSRANQTSIGVEICMHRGIDQDAAFLRAARLIAALCHDLRFGRDQVVTHYHWTRKRCPVLLLDNGAVPGVGWQKFLDLVQRELSTID